jgi:nucleotide-binding universal stress UspA family protein
MFQRILVPTDLTDTTHRALELAVNLARQRFAARVTLMHVVERVPNLEDDELRDFYDRLKKDACGRIQQLVGEVAGSGEMSVTPHVVLGKPADEILKYAHDNQTELIVLEHGREPRTHLGSVSYKVSVLAPCSVMLLK